MVLTRTPTNGGTYVEFRSTGADADARAIELATALTNEHVQPHFVVAFDAQGDGTEGYVVFWRQGQ